MRTPFTSVAFCLMLLLYPLMLGAQNDKKGSTSRPSDSAKAQTSAAERFARLRAKTTYYVNAKTGDDANSGVSDVSPFKSIQRAANLVHPGDAVIVRSGIYRGFHLESIGRFLRVIGAEARITFIADPGASIQDVAPNDSSGNAIVVNLNDGGQDNRICPVTIEGFTINGSKGTIANDGIFANRCDSFVAANNTVLKCKGQGIFVRYAIKPIIERNSCYRNGTLNTQHGIYLTNSSFGAVIRGNHCYENAGSGIHTNGDQTEGGDGSGMIKEALIESNICHNNGSNEINSDGLEYSTIRNNLLYNPVGPALHIFTMNSAEDSKGNKIYNNTVFAGARHTCVELQSAPNTTFFNNILCGQAQQYTLEVSDQASLVGLLSDYNLFTEGHIFNGAKPLTLVEWRSIDHLDTHSKAIAENEVAVIFVNARAGDFHLARGSAATRAGTSRLSGTSAPLIDLEKKSRSNAEGIDIGAYRSEREGVRQAK